MITCTVRDAESPIARRTEFDAGNLTGKWVEQDRDRYTTLPTGQLPEAEAKALTALLNDKRRLYVVYSYGTPIAWGVGLGPLTVPSEYYSQSTSKHQNIARRAS